MRHRSLAVLALAAFCAACAAKRGQGLAPDYDAMRPHSEKAHQSLDQQRSGEP